MVRSTQSNLELQAGKPHQATYQWTALSGIRRNRSVAGVKKRPTAYDG